MVRHAPIHRRSGYSDIAICCGRNVRGSSLSTSVVPLSNQVTTVNHKRFKGFKMFSDGHLEHKLSRSAGEIIMYGPKWTAALAVAALFALQPTASNAQSRIGSANSVKPD